jgi:hypothetical protein
LSTYGPILSADTVERMVRDTVAKWWKDYMAEFERQTGKPPRYYAEPLSYEVSSEFTEWADDRLPVILVVSPGLAEQPTYNNQYVMGEWQVGVAAIVGGIDRRSTRDNQMAYAAVNRLILHQIRRLGETSPDPDQGVIIGSKWVDEGYRDMTAVDTRTFGSSTVVFNVQVKVMDTKGKPPQKQPLDDPYGSPVGDWPTVTSTPYEITKEPLS